MSGENVKDSMKVDAQGHLTSYKADVNFDKDFTPDTEVIETKNGKTYLAESEKRSAPYFDVLIGGITLLNSKF